MKHGAVSVLALSQFVSEEVKRLINDEQEPTFSARRVKNFVMALLKSDPAAPPARSWRDHYLSII
jgi:hypothetical protein